jgi:hypothetical protein
VTDYTVTLADCTGVVESWTVPARDLCWSLLGVFVLRPQDAVAVRVGYAHDDSPLTEPERNAVVGIECGVPHVLRRPTEAGRWKQARYYAQDSRQTSRDSLRDGYAEHALWEARAAAAWARLANGERP